MVPIQLSTKADTLKSLKPILNKAKIEAIFSFTVSDWKINKEEILKEIQDKFSDKIVVRSSSINEDTMENSMAGYFESVLNIDSQNSSEVIKAINQVLDSYTQKKSSSAFNQVLIQSHSKNIIMSGVVFTRSIETNSPYYIINYDNTSSLTDTVTGGISNKSVKVYKKVKLHKKNRIYRLIESVKEIEKLFPSISLDIEFGINNKEEVIIFQVRPITNNKNRTDDKEMNNRINYLIDQFNILSKPLDNLSGDYTIFADMPDWNPAEIIGDNPGYLDYSLYDYIITNEIWHKARTSQGYYNIKTGKLVYLFGNKPYVDVRKTFNSFIPSSISKNLHKKLISFYMDKLKRYPELQDKVEFEVLFTCYDFSFDQRSEELREKGFNEYEIKELRDSLVDLTNNLILNSKLSIEEDMNSLKILAKNRKAMKIDYENDLIFESLKKSRFLLDDCREKGTLQFSRLARLGFIGNILLKSLVKKGIIPNELLESFFLSINTVATEFTKDFDNLLIKKKDYESFIKKYSHLRPGTYDITSIRYGSNPHLLKSIKSPLSLSKINKSFRLSSELSERINTELKREGLMFSATDLFEFARKAAEARELSKFEFTKNLSDAIELIAIAGNEMGFSRKEISFLGIKDLFQQFETKKELINYLKKQIIIRKNKTEINNKLFLPPIIFSQDSFKIVRDYSPKPNFITHKKTIAKTLKLEKNSQNSIHLNGKIILIENGDPGFDWIFTKGIGGLITKYGGVASHMSIRCAEFGIPAAIGCGSLYDKIMDKQKIILDCANKKINLMEIK